MRHAGASPRSSEHGLAGEVVVADNGSDDGSAELADGAGAARRARAAPRLRQRLPGRASRAAQGRLHRDGRRRPHLRLRRHPALRRRSSSDGAELVMGDRMDNIQPGAMPWLHRYVGNPVLTGILNLFFRTGVKDAHCGMRAVRRDVAARARPAHDRHGVRLRDGHPRRQGGPRDPRSCRSSTTRAAASRSSRASATAGATCASCSCTARRTCSSCPGARDGAARRADHARRCSRSSSVFGREWDLHTMIARRAADDRRHAGAWRSGLCAHAYGTYFMGERDPWFDRMRARFRLEHGLLLGGAVTLAGLALGGRDRRHLDRPRLRRAVRGAAGGARGDAR